MIEKLNTAEYRAAMSGSGSQAANWNDKPHRLVYDLCIEIERLRASNARLVEALKGLLPLAGWALAEQSPPGFDQPLVDAAESAINSAEGSAALTSPGEQS